ncbi:MAG: serine hydrolase [Anaerolineales bacterium]|nr:serine hydrolase [Anaerolineales bacterium]MDP7544463.1 serine hydrolase [Anaerolineales bacterium]MDP7643536.1 serine hydrolase [Anaerolineales bacterium]HJL70785.1 serine hydrolase [Anaerolineales bacterium]HJN41526.1 serine hydrolase [Anaerolineales bacterium]|tara:strand:+ start:1099 stop:2535 length:1437 start_codon:yes stop_codon:yes gene_type:complete
MRQRPNTTLLEWTAILLVLATVLALVLQLVAFQRVRATFPSGMMIANVPVGGLSLEQSEATLSQIYATPVELHFQDEVFFLEPVEISFRLALEAMLARADIYRTDTSFWSGFWNYLWRRSGNPVMVPVVAEYSTAQLREFLEDVAARYDLLPTPVSIEPGSLRLRSGSPGYSLDVESSLAVIDLALRVPTNRRVVLTVQDGASVSPTTGTLGDLLNRYMEQLDFEGVVSLAVVDLQTGEELNLNADVAYAGLSIMKIPIVLDMYRVLDFEPFPEIARVIEGTIVQSSNLHANILLAELGGGDPSSGASVLTADLQRLGLLDSFMAGYFDQEVEPPVVRTPANQRTDINTDPDPFMQTTPADMAALLTMLYQCAQHDGGGLAVAFAGEVTRAECDTVIELLSRNKTATLIEAGVPEGTTVAHKHGFGSGDTIADAGIVFSPGGDYVVVIYLWHPVYLEWEQSAPMAANISRMVYHYFNP